MIQVNPTNPDYWINSRALSFSENDLDDPNRVAVSLVSGTVIKAYKKGLIDYAFDGEPEKWTLKGYSTKLVNPAAHYIYARLSRTDRTALIVFSVKNYNIDGSITTVNEADGTSTTTDPSADYFYIKIGELTATDSATNPTIDRELTYDSGLLSTDKGKEESNPLNEMWELSKMSTPWLIRAKQWLSSFTVKGFITLVGGLIFKNGETEKPVTDIKRSTDSDEDVPVSDESIPTTKYVLSVNDDRYLRKDQDDRTPYNLGVGGNMQVDGTLDVGSNAGIGGKLGVSDKVTAQKGIQIGESFVPGILTGSGGFFDEFANGEVESLIVRRFLEVPELRFNRVEIKLGDKWNAPGAGVLESVVPDIDEEGNRLMTGTGYLKLEEGEYGAIAVGDICMGIYHSMNSEENATEDKEIYGTTEAGEKVLDGFQFSGFYTCYFTISEITGKDNRQFRYQMRPVSDRWNIAFHPSEAMTFVCYGSFTRDDRQTSVYTTRTYTRLLKNQNTWEISVDNIAMQYGNMENLSIHGLDMSGYSMYLKNIYMTGVLKQVKPDGTPVNSANDRGNYISGEVYAYYDRVSHDGSLWLCVNENGTTTEPFHGNSDWLLQVASGASLSAEGRFNSSNTPYQPNSVVEFAEKVWINTAITSDAPYGCFTDNEGNRLLFSDGGFVLSDEEQSKDWTVLIDISGFTDGKDGAGLIVQYSSDKVNWHETFQDSDVYMRQKVGEDGVWSAAMRIVGEDGQAKDGIYTEFQFSVGSSLTVAPTSGWQDAPPAVALGQFLWMRVRVVNPNEGTTTSWEVTRIGGEKGDTGQDGKDGQSVSLQGDWKTGVSVPYLGVVRMGGTSWSAKKETANPPLWCWTDNGGNRLLFGDGGYIITGDTNDEEYQEVASDGTDGIDGVNGRDGKDGAQGIQGCIVRDSEWAAGVEYRNDEGLTGGTRYIDVALVRDSSTTTGWNAFKCKKTHVSSTGITTANSDYWEEFSANVTSIFTSLIIAKNAKITFLQGNQLLVQKENGSVTAGISGSEEGEKVRFWAGSETPDDASFSVTEEGVATATKFRTAKNGVRLEAQNGVINIFGSFMKNIEFGVNEEGLAVMRYYDSDGTLLYDLGPSGISVLRRDKDKWVLKRLTYLGVDADALFGGYWTTAKNPVYDTGENKYQYLSGYIGGVLDDSVNHRKLFNSQSKSDSNVISDGWYCDTLPENATDLNRFHYMEGILPDDMNENNPSVDTSLPIYVTQAFYVMDGLVFNRMNVYYNIGND